MKHSLIVTASPTAGAVLLHGTPYALSVLVLLPLTAGLPSLLTLIIRWKADQPRRERDRIRNQALRRIGQESPERLLELLPRLPPSDNPFQQSSPEPASLPAVAPPGDPPTDAAPRTG